jgi:hypothetical protein
MNRLNSHFLRSSTCLRDVSGDGQIALVVKLGVSPSRSRLLTGPYRYHQGIVQQAQGRSAETSVSPHHNNQSTIYNPVGIRNLRSEDFMQGKEPIFCVTKYKQRRSL